jgi:thiol-disulfide isomerase/thioredoxin
MKLKNSFRDLFLPAPEQIDPIPKEHIPWKTQLKEYLKEHLFITIFFIAAIVMLVLSIVTSAQEKKVYKALEVGDTVPSITLQNVVNYKAGSIKLSDFRGKLLIIDFWGTFCVPCVQLIPRMDSLQSEFCDRIQILQATNQTPETIRPFLKKFFKEHNIKQGVPCITNDHVLGKLFPHAFVPHYVWISPDGKVLAFTADFDVTKENIESVLRSGQLQKFMPKYDINVNKPLFSSDRFPVGQMVNYAVLIKGHLEGTGSGNHKRVLPNAVGIAMTNMPLGDLYQNCAGKVIKGGPGKRIIYHVKDTSFIAVSGFTHQSRQWHWDREYSVDVIVPKSREDSLYYDVVSELNLNGRYSAHFVTRQSKYLRLVVIDPTRPFLSKGGSYQNTLADTHNRMLRNAGMNNLVAWMNDDLGFLPIAVDDSGVTDMVALRISDNATTLEALKKELNQQGLDLVESEGPLQFLEINEPNPKQP